MARGARSHGRTPPTLPPRSGVEVEGEHLRRYASVLPDFDAFWAALQSPLPQTLAVNTERLSPEALAAGLAKANLSLTPLPWRPGAFRLAPEDRPGRHWRFSAGHFTVQEEASLLPVALLDAQPGDRVLDLCCAPGNKTALLALALGNRGTVLANDLQESRLAAVHDLLRRLGLMNVSTLCGDGVRLPLPEQSFDRILIDAPCTAEGKAQRGYLRASSPGFRAALQKTQRRLLDKALTLCRPGGRMVYSTCTFAPEENEAVLTAFLNDHGAAVRVLPLASAPPGASPGLEAFEGQRFHPSLRHACRLWPHRTGTGGFFAVTLEKTGTGARAAFGPSALPSATKDPRLPALFARFGLKEAAAGPWHYFDSPRNVRMVAADHEAPKGPRYLTHGLDLARNRAKVAKLSTPAAMALGPLATASVLDLSEEAFSAYRQREDAPLSPKEIPPHLTPGAVLVRFDGTFQGIALLHQTADAWRLESQYPKAWLRDKT